MYLIHSTLIWSDFSGPSVTYHPTLQASCFTLHAYPTTTIHLLSYFPCPLKKFHVRSQALVALWSATKPRQKKSSGQPLQVMSSGYSTRHQTNSFRDNLSLNNGTVTNTDQYLGSRKRLYTCRHSLFQCRRLRKGQGSCRPWRCFSPFWGSTRCPDATPLVMAPSKWEALNEFLRQALHLTGKQKIQPNKPPFRSCWPSSMACRSALLPAFGTCMHPTDSYWVSLSVTQRGLVTPQGIIPAHISECRLLMPTGIKCLPGSCDVSIAAGKTSTCTLKTPCTKIPMFLAWVTREKMVMLTLGIVTARQRSLQVKNVLLRAGVQNTLLRIYSTVWIYSLQLPLMYYRHLQVASSHQWNPGW